MKKITFFLFALFCFVFTWHSNAQFTENFDSNTTMPAGWSVINQGGANGWTIFNVGNTVAHSGTNVARIQYNLTAHDDYLISPAINVTAGVNDRVSFFIKSINSGYLEPYEVLLSTTTNTASTDFSVVLQAEETSTQYWEQKEFFLSDYVGETVYIAIRATGTNEDRLAVDDFVNDAIPSCPAPSASIASNLTSSSADLSWTENGTSTNWDIEWGVDGFTPTGTPNVNDTGDNPYELTGLSADTDYDFYVRSDCGADDTSDVSTWTGPFSFSTLVSCPAPTALTASNITTTSADLGWTENGTSANWDIEWGIDGFTPTGTPNVNDTADNPYELTGLTAATAYDFYVRSDCGADDTSDTSVWVGPFSFITECDAIGDFTEGFESYASSTDPICWSENLGGSTGYVYVSTSDVNTGTKALRSGNNGSATAVQYIISPPLLDMSAGTHRLRFSVYGSTTITLVVGRLSDPQDMGTFTPVQTIPLVTTHTDHTVYFNTPNTDSYFAFKMTYSSTYYSVSLDDVVWETSPSCIEPSSLVATNITTNSADLGWTEIGSASLYNVEVVPAGATPTGTPTDSSVANGFTKTGLTSATDYEYYVQADCTGGDLSAWSGPFSFTTLCDSVDNFDENFDSVSTPNLPNCWSRVIDNGASTSATVGTVTTNNSAPNGVSLYNSSSTASSNIILVSPILSNLSAGSHQLRFMARNSTSSQDIQVGTIADPTDGTTFTSIETVDINGTFTEYTVDFSGYTGSDTYIAIRRLSTSTYTYVYLDDIKWEEIPTCLAPTTLTASNITTTSADLGWTENGTSANWDIEWGIDGFTPTGTPNVNDTADNPYELTGLTASTSYDFYVRSDCGADDTSDTSVWVGPFSFNTSCEATNVPYVQDFNASTSIPVCTTVTNEGAGAYQWQVVAVTDYGFTPNHLRIRWDGSNAANSWFFTQGLNLTGGVSYSVSYDYGGTGTTFPEKLRVAYGTSQASVAMVNPLADHPNVVNNGPINNSVDFTPATTGVYYIGFQAYSNANQFYLHLDNVSVDVTLSNPEMNNEDAFTYYPNPVKNTLHLTAQSNIQSVSIFNMLGQEVMRTAPNNVNSTVDMSALQTGAYFVKVTINDRTETIRVIKN